MSMYALLSLFSLLSFSASQNCSAPPPATNFQLSDFYGSWYEVARIQTAGGNAIQQFCACTELIYTPTNDSNVGDASVLNSCRFESPSGFFLNATSYLTNMTKPGHWLEAYCPLNDGCPPASYNIILDGVDANGTPYAVEYDCSNNALFGNNYCLHFLSRKPDSMDATTLSNLVNQTTVVMGLNPENRVVNMTWQQGCW